MYLRLKILKRILSTSTLYMLLALLFSNSLGISTIVTAMNNYSKPGVLASVKTTMYEMSLIKLRAVVFDASNLPISIFILFATHQRNFPINKTLRLALCIILVNHVRILMKYELAKRIIIIVICLIIHVYS